MNETTRSAKAEAPREVRATVVNTTGDPKRLLRVQVRVPGLWDGVPDQDLPWAEYRFQSARASGGSFEPAQKGDWVWVDFPMGDSRYPRITGWCHYAPDGIPNAPHDSFVGPDKIVHKVNQTAGEPKPQEPKYHGSYVFERHGVVLEVNPGGEWLLTQRSSGTAIRITADGTITIHGENKVHVSSESDTIISVAGNLVADVKGDAKVDVGGNSSVHTKGFSQHITDGSALVKSSSRLVLKGPSRTLVL